MKRMRTGKRKGLYNLISETINMKVSLLLGVRPTGKARRAHCIHVHLSLARKRTASDLHKVRERERENCPSISPNGTKHYNFLKIAKFHFFFSISFLLRYLLHSSCYFPFVSKSHLSLPLSCLTFF